MKNVLDLFRDLPGIEIKENQDASTEGGEWKTACPICCAGKDRLWIQPKIGQSGRWKCRICGKGGNAVSFCIEILKMPQEDMGAIMRFLKGDLTRTVNMVKPITIQKHKPTPVKKPTPEWIKQITKITIDAHEYLLQAYEYDIKGTPTHKQKYGKQRDIMLILLLRGITEDTIKEFKIGYNPEFIKLSPNKKDIYVPPGITIPFMNLNETLKLKIKGHIPPILENPEHRFSITAEGQNGLSHILRNTDNFIITEAELDMYTLYSQLGPNFSYIATGNNLSLPDNQLHPIVKKCTNLFICHDNDSAGTTMYIRWKKEYPHAKPTPTPKGKDPGEAFNLQVNLKQFFMEKI